MTEKILSAVFIVALYAGLLYISAKIIERIEQSDKHNRQKNYDTTKTITHDSNYIRTKP